MTDTPAEALKAGEPTPAEIIAFLNGERPLDDVWFGDAPSSAHRGGRFWWRKYLPLLASATDAGEVRERIARIIEPDAWDDQETSRTARLIGSVKEATDLRDALRQATLAKADAILALSPQAPSPNEGDWQPIETAPRDGTWLLCYWAGTDIGEYQNRYGVAAWTSMHGDGDSWYEGSGAVGDPTHWRPLPAPPAAAIRRLGE